MGVKICSFSAGVLSAAVLGLGVRLGIQFILAEWIPGISIRKHSIPMTKIAPLDEIGPE